MVEKKAETARGGFGLVKQMTINELSKPSTGGNFTPSKSSIEQEVGNQVGFKRQSTGILKSYPSATIKDELKMKSPSNLKDPSS